jgi:hypothetical protein
MTLIKPFAAFCGFHDVIRAMTAASLRKRFVGDDLHFVPKAQPNYGLRTAREKAVADVEWLALKEVQNRHSRPQITM